MRTYWRALALAAGVLLSGIAQSFDAPMALPGAEARAKQGEDQTLVVFSTWAAGPSKRSVSELVIVDVTDNRMVKRALIDEPRLPSHFSSGWGYLNAARLAPGTYRIELYSEEPWYEYEKASRAITFTVKKGPPLYLGEFALSFKKDVGRLDIRDRSVRDLPLFKEKNPDFDIKTLKKAILKKPRV